MFHELDFSASLLLHPRHLQDRIALAHKLKRAFFLIAYFAHICAASHHIFPPLFGPGMLCAITIAAASALVALSVQFFSIVVKILQKPECVSRINNLKKQHKKYI